MKSSRRYSKCWHWFASSCLLMLAGCGPVLMPIMMPMPPGVTIVHELPVPDAALKYGSGTTAVNPNDYRVDPNDYPLYRVAAERSQPGRGIMFDGKLVTFAGSAPLGPIYPNETWEVRYRFGTFLMVNSSEFDKRQCELFARPWDKRPCTFHGCIYISRSGEVTGGWDDCPCPDCGKNKFLPDPDTVKLQDWGPQPFFQVVERRGKSVDR